MKKLGKIIIILTYVSFVLTGVFMPLNFSFAQTGGATGSFDDPRCTPPQVIKDGKCVTPTSTPYQLLAPIKISQGQNLVNFDPGDNNALGRYLNIMIKLIIGLSAVMAVVMIVIGGMEYMTSELVSSKEAGKERIRDALLGLVIALGAYALLFTINPDLLSTDINIDPATIQVVLQEDRDGSPPSLSPFTGALPTGAVAGCQEGVVKSASTGIVACSNISGNIDQMVAAARQASLVIWAGGFRTAAQQTALRQQHCNGNVSDPRAPCNPPTAVPGTSRHESGLALDLTCNGTTIQSPSNACFIWLRNNASRYGFQNLIGGTEPWHWSTDGH